MKGADWVSIPSPQEIHQKYPVESSFRQQIASYRKTSTQILSGQDSRIALLIGPCSIHDPIEAFEYARRLKRLQDALEPTFFLILRAFLEKPRSHFGWKGFLYDPYLDGSDQIEKGIESSRKFLIELVKLGVPAASELLDPLAVPYYADLLTWGVIGARTAASQPHRQLASSLPFPVGFKNTIHGELEPAVFGVDSARNPQSMLGINEQGKISTIKSFGNPWTHLILRGSNQGKNCDPKSIQKALDLLKKHHLNPIIGIDCSHGNSGKDLLKQKLIFQETIELISRGKKEIRMVMLESYLERGHQPLDSKEALTPGLSITDPCLSWQETEELLRATL